MRIFAICFCVSLGAALPAQGFESDPLRSFAVCAGRLSAVMEHQWMFDGPASDLTKARRADVLDLIDAVADPDQRPDVLQWRMDAKYAQSVLLDRATFNDDPADAAWAREQAIRHHNNCTSMLLS